MSDRASTPIRVTIRVSVCWWVAPYMHALGLFALLTGNEPDPGKLADLLQRKGLRVTTRVL